jgi:hypothetical protein
METIVEELADNAGRVHSLLESVDDLCVDSDIPLDEIRALVEYALGFNEAVFKTLDKLSLQR